jgi:hypothetical protein
MSEHDDGGVATSTAFLQAGANQLTANPGTLMFRPNRHRREARDGAIPRRFDGNGREENVPDYLFTDRCDERQIVRCPPERVAQRIDEARFERTIKRERIRLANARLITWLFEAHGNQRSPISNQQRNHQSQISNQQ